MTPKLDPRSARQHLQAFRFADLFVEDLGWNHPERAKPLVFEQDGTPYQAREISQLSGFRVLEVTATTPDGPFPDAKTQQALWKKISPLAVENLLIFVDPARTRSAWLWMKRDGKKTHPRRHHYLKGQPGDLFLSKLASLVVDLSELDEDGNIPITETARRVREGLDIETVTKAFFRDFQEEHGKLLEAIEGIPDPGERRWYASVLLNRLMFIWFLQRKGFLDVGRNKVGNLDYLPEKLAASQADGKNRFFSRFLRDLFFEGFAKTAEKREPVGTVPLGDIPYLNGGLFLPHGIEARIEGEALFAKAYAKIKVPDAVFADLFALFAAYSWSLNDTPGGDDREINPDVLGYIFEKYINQKEFGAYYTRPEITDYLCEQTIHQLVLDRVNASYDAAKKLHETAPKAFPAPRRYESIEDLLLHATGPVCQKVLQDILPRLSLLDPACGSGAFLVAALKTLLNLYTALVGRCEALAHAPILQWIEHEKKQHKAPVAYWLKKKIVTENLYGVDLMEEATEIAKLRLFLTLVASAESRDQLEPLPNIEFNLLPGNSLIGLLHVDPAKFEGSAGVSPASSKKRLQQARITLAYEEALGFTTETTTAPTTREKQQAHIAIKQSAKYDELLRKKNERIDLYKKSTSLFKDLAGLKRDIDALKTEARAILDQLLLDQFQALGIQFEQATWIPGSSTAEAKKSSAPTGRTLPAQGHAASSAPTGRNITAQGNALGSEPETNQALKGRNIPGGKEGKPEKRPLKLADIQALQPFHWAYEFDDIIVNRGGFDAIITNPPWEVWKPQAKEFFNDYAPHLMVNNTTIKEFEKEQAKLLADPEIRDAWLSYLSLFPHVSSYFRTSPQYPHQISVVGGKKTGTDINLYKLFTEQCVTLLTENGRCGFIVPTGLYSDLGSTGLREMIFTRTRVTQMFGISNERFLFEGVDHRFKICIGSFQKSGATREFAAAFRINPREALAAKDLESFFHTPAQHVTLRVADIRRLSPDSISIIEFRSPLDTEIVFKSTSHPRLAEDLGDGWGIRLQSEFHMTNDSHLFQVEKRDDFLPLFEGKMIHHFDHRFAEARYWVDPAEARAAVLGRVEDCGQMLDYQAFRLGIRKIARTSDERTLIGTIVPPNFHGESFQTVRTFERGERIVGNDTLLYLCAVWSTLTLDYLLRMRVSANVNFFYMYQLPIPRLTSADPDFRPLVERAARLVGTTAEFDDLLVEVFGKKATHKTHGVTDPQDRLTLRAQIDALVARLYDLTIPEFQHILGTFPLVDESVKSQTLNTYRELVKLGKFA
ncbi:MAG: ATP-binding protein [Verrucomicrobia bacterium]|nr:ATP-binding protein [Verrucomicrobiota bacterium]